MTRAIAEANRDDWPVAGEIIQPKKFGPFTYDALAHYAAASGDDNPLHLDREAAAWAGLDGSPVHGMLMLSYFESLLMSWRQDFFIVKFSAKFLQPVLVGQSIILAGRVLRSLPGLDAGLLLRLTARDEEGGLVILAEATAARQDNDLRT